jgi:hypothetical protein
MCLNEVYKTNEFPEKFYGDLVLRGWSYVLEELSEKL